MEQVEFLEARQRRGGAGKGGKKAGKKKGGGAKGRRAGGKKQKKQPVAHSSASSDDSDDDMLLRLAAPQARKQLKQAQQQYAARRQAAAAARIAASRTPEEVAAMEAAKRAKALKKNARRLVKDQEAFEMAMGGIRCADSAQQLADDEASDVLASEAAKASCSYVSLAGMASKQQEAVVGEGEEKQQSGDKGKGEGEGEAAGGDDGVRLGGVTYLALGYQPPTVPSTAEEAKQEEEAAAAQPEPAAAAPVVSQQQKVLPPITSFAAEFKRGQALNKAGKFGEAVLRWQRLLKPTKTGELLGKELQRATAMVNLGVSYQGLKQAAKSLAWFQRGVAVFRKHPKTLNQQALALGNCAQAYHDLGKTALATRTLQLAQALLNAHHGRGRRISVAEGDAVLNAAISGDFGPLMEVLQRQECCFDMALYSHSAAGATALMIAAGASNLEAMKLLLDVGAQPNARDKRNMSPVHWALQFGTPAAMHLLESRGGDATCLMDDNDVATPPPKPTPAEEAAAAVAAAVAGPVAPATVAVAATAVAPPVVPAQQPKKQKEAQAQQQKQKQPTQKQKQAKKQQQQRHGKQAGHTASQQNDEQGKNRHKHKESKNSTKAGAKKHVAQNVSAEAAAGKLVGRELQSWAPSPEDAALGGLEDDVPAAAATAAAGGESKWDQFEANARLFGVDAGFDEAAYTTPVAGTEAQKARAAALAAEILASSKANSPQAAVGEEGMADEEALYSAVLKSGSGAAAAAAAGDVDEDDTFTDAAISRRTAAGK